jgi:hypothetical protein
MKQTLTILALLAVVQLAFGQDKLPREEALKYAAVATADAKQLSGTPIATDVDTQQPVALLDGEYGGMVLPQKNLKIANLTEASETVVPVGQLWLLKLAPMQDGQAISSEKLRLATVKHDGEVYTVPQCTLGVRRKAGAMELVVLGKDKSPLLTAPLKAVESKQDMPIDLAAERESYSGQITVKILGKYQAQFSVTELQL